MALASNVLKSWAEDLHPRAKGKFAPKGSPHEEPAAKPSVLAPASISPKYFTHTEFAKHIGDRINLSPKDHDALKAWQSTGYKEIRAAQAGKLKGKEAPKFKEHAERIEAAIDRKEQGFGHTEIDLHRGLSMSKATASRLKVGGVLKEPTLSSWTSDSRKASQYAKHQDGVPVVLHVSNAKRTLPVGTSAWESEHVMGGGHGLHVTHVEMRDGVHHAWVEQKKL